RHATVRPMGGRPMVRRSSRFAQHEWEHDESTLFRSCGHPARHANAGHDLWRPRKSIARELGSFKMKTRVRWRPSAAWRSGAGPATSAPGTSTGAAATAPALSPGEDEHRASEQEHESAHGGDPGRVLTR